LQIFDAYCALQDYAILNTALDSACGHNPLNTEILMIKVERPPTDPITTNNAALDERGRVLHHQK